MKLTHVNNISAARSTYRRLDKLLIDQLRFLNRTGTAACSHVVNIKAIGKLMWEGAEEMGHLYW